VYRAREAHDIGRRRMAAADRMRSSVVGDPRPAIAMPTIVFVARDS
jgi:hypothetical protein